MSGDVARDEHVGAVRGLLRRFPVVAILGLRQVGKTTLARAVARRDRGATFFDLEDPADVRRLGEAGGNLRSLRGLVVLDEVQRRPEIFPLLRVLADRAGAPARFLVLGSAGPALLQQSSESLAGRIAFHEIGGFGLDEVGAPALDRLWLRGGLPRSFLARNDDESAEWRRSFQRSFLERDVPSFGVTIPPTTLGRFWSMLAHYHGQTWNGSEFARSFGVADTTVRRYLDLLAALFVVRLLPPWFENLGKRQVKSPKVYLTDPGLLHSQLGLTTANDLAGHPKVGASWEGFLLQQVVRRLGARTEECFFWATQSGAELDLLVVRGKRRLGFEFKRTDAPTVTPSMRIALKDLGLESIVVVHAGDATFEMAPKIRAVGAPRILKDLSPLR
jgi:predicted AAA+ superfamily ATPase